MTIRIRRAGLAVLLCLQARAAVCGEQQPTPAQQQAPGIPGTVTGAAPMTASADTIDRVIAIVNGELILESDVDEERRFAAFQPFSAPAGTVTRESLIERLINRTLILQQSKLQASSEVKDADVAAQLQMLKKEIPACREAQCETDAGWSKFLAKQEFTPEQLQERWKERMQVLQYIENRFRMGIRIPPEEIKEYYDKTLLPEFSKRKATAPKLADISDRIQEILLQQQVGKLLQDWLKSLRAQGTVQIRKPGEVAP